MNSALGATIVLALLGGATAASGASVGPENGEAGWRTDGTGRYPDATPPLTWSVSRNVIWKLPMRNWSNATPVPHKGLIFTCEEPSTLVAVDQEKGEVRWRAELPYEKIQDTPSAPEQKRRDELSRRQIELQQRINKLSGVVRERPEDGTAVKDLADARAELQAVSGDIRQVYQRLRLLSLPQTHTTNGYTSPTPVAAGDRVWVLFGTGVAAAFDLAGTRIWARIVGRPTNSWGHSASPLLVDGKLILHIGRTVYALDPETGRELWAAPSASFWGTPFPVAVGGQWAIVTSGGDLIRCRDGKVLSDQIGDIPWTSPLAGDGVIYIVDQNGASAWALPAAFDDEVHLERRWRTRVLSERYYASPLLHQGLLYAMTQYGQMTVLDAASGAVVYEHSLKIGVIAYQSFCLAGGMIFASSETGKTLVFEPGREFREIAVNTLESFRGTPVFSGSRIYIRGLKHLWCLGARD